MESVRIIKYNNRKLFIPKQGYVTLRDIEKFIRTNVKFDVVDYDTKKDVTSTVLGQLIATKEDLTVEKIKQLL